MAEVSTIKQPTAPPQGAIYPAMIRAMRAIPALGKDAVNEQQRWNYRSAEALYNACHRIFKREGIFIVTEIIESKRLEHKTKYGSQPLTLTNFRIHFYAEDGSSIAVETQGEAADSGDKSSGKALTYAIKSALQAMFLIPTEDMDDPDAHAHKLDEEKEAEELISDDQVTRFYTIATSLGIKKERAKTLCGVDSAKKIKKSEYENKIEKLKEEGGKKLKAASERATDRDALEKYAAPMLEFFPEGTEARKAYAKAMRELANKKKPEVPERLLDWINDLRDQIKTNGKDTALQMLAESGLSDEDKKLLESTL